VSADDLITLVIAIDRFNDQKIDIVEARRLIMPLFELRQDDCANRDLVDDLDRVLDDLRTGNLTPGAVVNELTRRAARQA